MYALNMLNGNKKLKEKPTWYLFNTFKVLNEEILIYSALQEGP
jgi:hypothetical protein